MNKILSAEISSADVADLLAIPHSHLVRQMADMVPAGWMDVSKLKNDSRGELRLTSEARLSLHELVAICVYMQPHHDQVRAIINRWLDAQTRDISIRYAGEREQARRDARHGERYERSRTILQRAFADDLGFLQALRAIENGDAKVDFTPMGIRASKDGRLVIGTGTPFMMERAAAIDLSTHAISAALRALPGAERAGTTRFNGHPSKSIKVRALVLLEALGQ